MPETPAKPAKAEPTITALQLDLSRLVGRTIHVYSNQVPGKAMATKVLSYTARELLVSSAGGDGMIENLVSKQKVILQFPYKGQTISVRASLKRSQGGRCYFVMGDEVVPLSQRRFHRIRRICAVNLAPVPAASFGTFDVSRLRWMRTDTVNFSSGGVMLNMSSFIPEGTYMLLHVELPDTDLLPDLVLAQVRHCFQAELALYKVGVEFLVREACEKQLPAGKRRLLPSTALSYSAQAREQLNNDVRAWMQNAPNMD